MYVIWSRENSLCERRLFMSKPEREMIDPSEIKNAKITNTDPEFLAALAKLKRVQQSENHMAVTEKLEVDKDGFILLDPNNPTHREWMGDDE